MSTIDSEMLMLPSVVVRGVHTPGTTTAVKAAAVASGTSAYTFTAAYPFTWRGAHIAFKKNTTYILDAAEASALLAASAPMTAA